MKKLFTLFTFVFFSLTVLAVNVVVDDIKYSIDYGKREATVIAKTSWNGYSGEVVIPASITALEMEFSVTGIGKNAFYFCPNLTSITIPNTITSIDKYAFYECSRLTSVNITDLSAWCKIIFNDNLTTSSGVANPLYYARKLFLNGEEVKDLVIPDDVTSIGKYAFYNCSGLTSVTIPNSVTSIGTNAFYKCSNLTSVNITDLSAWCKIDFGSNSNLLQYAHKLFLNGEEVKDLVIPDDVTSIGNSTFSGYSSLTSVTIHNSVTSIGEYAFNGCSGLTSITIPNSVTSIGKYAFTFCSGLTSITIPNSVTSIGEEAFSWCDGLTSVTIPNSVTTIGENAFMYCYGLTSVNITDLSAWCKIEFGILSSNPLYYARKLFLNGEEVKDLVIPDDVTSISKRAFYYCSGLTSVTIPNSVTSIGESAFVDCSGLTSVTIPNSVTSIGERAFASCSGLTYVTLGNSVESIGLFAFENCENLENVYCLADNVPTTHSSAFRNVDNCTLYVPEGSIENYKATEPWSRFGHILSLEDAPDIPTTISSVNGVNTTKSQIYCLDGTRFNTFQHGINIIKTAKGIKKVMK